MHNGTDRNCRSLCGRVNLFDEFSIIIVKYYLISLAIIFVRQHLTRNYRGLGNERRKSKDFEMTG
jgi:hypothetical protein